MRPFPREVIQLGQPDTDTRRLVAGSHPVRCATAAGPRAFRHALSLARRSGRRPRGFRDQLRSELDVGRGKDRAPRHFDRWRTAGRAHDAGYRMLRADRFRRAHAPRGGSGLRRSPDAAAFLLQERINRRLVSQLRGGHRAGRRIRSPRVSVSHSTGIPSTDQPGVDRATAPGLSGNDRRHQG